jgi:hypothetical protein
MFAASCIVLYLLSFQSGLIIPFTYYLGATDAVQKSMGYPNLPQFRHPAEDAWIDSFVLDARRAMVEIIKSRMAGQVPQRQHVHIVQKMRHNLEMLYTPSVTGKEKIAYYIQCAKGVLYSMDRLESVATMESLANVELRNPDVYTHADPNPYPALPPYTSQEAEKIVHTMSELFMSMKVSAETNPA